MDWSGFLGSALPRSRKSRICKMNPSRVQIFLFSLLEFNLWTGRDLNPRSPHCQRGAIPSFATSPLSGMDFGLLINVIKDFKINKNNNLSSPDRLNLFPRHIGLKAFEARHGNSWPPRPGAVDYLPYLAYSCLVS